MKTDIPKSHPRFLSLYYRELVVEGVTRGITSLAGLTAHGRGEAFDYLIGEKTQNFAKNSIKAAAAALLMAKYPVISVNGNTASLAPEELIKLANILKAPLEVNLFHPSKKRGREIVKFLKSYGAENILLPDNTTINKLQSNRRYISKDGQYRADVIFIPLEDGDRTQALLELGKKVIAVDLNPLSRTSLASTIIIIDHLCRCLPLLIQEIDKLKKCPNKKLEKILKTYNNRRIIAQALSFINKRFTFLSKIYYDK